MGEYYTPKPSKTPKQYPPRNHLPEKSNKKIFIFFIGNYNNCIFMDYWICLIEKSSL
jgi:hypothetical protein